MYNISPSNAPADAGMPSVGSLVSSGVVEMGKKLQVLQEIQKKKDAENEEIDMGQKATADANRKIMEREEVLRRVTREGKIGQNDLGIAEGSTYESVMNEYRSQVLKEGEDYIKENAKYHSTVMGYKQRAATEAQRGEINTFNYATKSKVNDYMEAQTERDDEDMAKYRTTGDINFVSTGIENNDVAKMNEVGNRLTPMQARKMAEGYNYGAIEQHSRKMIGAGKSAVVVEDIHNSNKLLSGTDPESLNVSADKLRYYGHLNRLTAKQKNSLMKMALAGAKSDSNAEFTEFVKRSKSWIEAANDGNEPGNYGKMYSANTHLLGDAINHFRSADGPDKKYQAAQLFSKLYGARKNMEYFRGSILNNSDEINIRPPEITKEDLLDAKEIPKDMYNYMTAYANELVGHVNDSMIKDWETAKKDRALLKGEDPREFYEKHSPDISKEKASIRQMLKSGDKDGVAKAEKKIDELVKRSMKKNGEAYVRFTRDEAENLASDLTSGNYLRATEALTKLQARHGEEYIDSINDAIKVLGKDLKPTQAYMMLSGPGGNQATFALMSDLSKNKYSDLVRDLSIPDTAVESHKNLVESQLEPFFNAYDSEFGNSIRAGLRDMVLMDTIREFKEGKSDQEVMIQNSINRLSQSIVPIDHNGTKTLFPNSWVTDTGKVVKVEQSAINNFIDYTKSVSKTTNWVKKSVDARYLDNALSEYKIKLSDRLENTKPEDKKAMKASNRMELERREQIFYEKMANSLRWRTSGVGKLRAYYNVGGVEKVLKGKDGNPIDYDYSKMRDSEEVRNYNTIEKRSIFSPFLGRKPQSMVRKFGSPDDMGSMTEGLEGELPESNDVQNSDWGDPNYSEATDPDLEPDLDFPGSYTPKGNNAERKKVIKLYKKHEEIDLTELNVRGSK